MNLKIVYFLNFYSKKHSSQLPINHNNILIDKCRTTSMGRKRTNSPNTLIFNHLLISVTLFLGVLWLLVIFIWSYSFPLPKWHHRAGSRLYLRSSFSMSRWNVYKIHHHRRRGSSASGIWRKSKYESVTKKEFTFVSFIWVLHFFCKFPSCLC